mmetsp:Transcript_3218/g.9850  ORF Transcript_3218/g.9850 Transcript_3218/m.9850 type:complete len:114 (+) Transcript_3218:690-1031(+)|eukprot:scaffold25371_cov34-Tisochrysis_lutea.AAC.3
MQPGDAIYIPALTFHTGGCDDVSDDSMLLSLALPPCIGSEAARDGVLAWRAARSAAISRIPSSGANSWLWASTEEGSRWMARIIGQNPDWQRFCIESQQVGRNADESRVAATA